MRQSERFLGRRLGPLLKPGLLLIRNLLKPLSKSVLVPLGLTAAATAADAAICKKMFGSGCRLSDLASHNTTLSILNEALVIKWICPLRISSVNVTKSAVSCRFFHI